MRRCAIGARRPHRRRPASRPSFFFTAHWARPASAVIPPSRCMLGTRTDRHTSIGVVTPQARGRQASSHPTPSTPKRQETITCAWPPPSSQRTGEPSMAAPLETPTSAPQSWLLILCRRRLNLGRWAGERPMVRTDRTREVLWGRSENRCAIGKDQPATNSGNDEPVIARTTAALSHGLKAHVAGGQIDSCVIVGSPNARLIPGVGRYSFWRE
jgi:hypothetical protein